MKLGIIGTGMIVREFLPELVKMEGLEIRSIMGSPSGFEKAQALSEQYGIPKAAHDLDELCAAGIDTVYVAIPNSLHFMYCKKALEKDKNVIVEKPMTDNAGEAPAKRSCFSSKQSQRSICPPIGRSASGCP